MRTRSAASIALLLLAATIAHAAPDEGARRAATEAWQRGKSAYNLGDFDQAITEWEKAYRLNPQPEFIYNLAQAYRKTKRYEKAIFSYRTFLRESLDTPPELRAQVEQRIAELERAQAQQGEGASPKAVPAPSGVTPPAAAKQPEATKPADTSSAWSEVVEAGLRSEGRLTRQDRATRLAAFPERQRRGTRVSASGALALLNRTVGYYMGRPLAFQGSLGVGIRHPINPRLDLQAGLEIGLSLGSTDIYGIYMDSPTTWITTGNGSTARATLITKDDPSWMLAATADVTLRLHKPGPGPYGYFGFGAKVGVTYSGSHTEYVACMTYSRASCTDAAGALDTGSVYLAGVLEAGLVFGANESWDAGIRTSIGTVVPNGPGFSSETLVLKVAWAFR